MRIINVQGTNGSGKSTLARSYIAYHKLTETELTIGGRKTVVQTNPAGDIFVIGKYSGGECGGCDTIRKTEYVLDTLIHLIKTRRPREILFEGILISGNQTFGNKVVKIARICGYAFDVYFLDRGADKCVNAVCQRNGGKKFNIKQVVDKYRSCERTANALAEQGANVKRVIPDHYSKDEVYKALYE